MSRTAAVATTDARNEALTRLGAAFKGVMRRCGGLRGRETHRPGELSFAQYHLLFHLAEQGELSTGQLATAAELVPATIDPDARRPRANRARRARALR